MSAGRPAGTAPPRGPPDRFFRRRDEPNAPLARPMVDEGAR